MDRQLSPGIAEMIIAIAEHARAEGLDFFETIFEPVNAEEMSAIAAYGGFPQRYSHWQFGMEYERLRKQHGYGLGRIYEMVINTDPCLAYLADNNEFVDQKTVIAHVYAHCDFFKNNMWFGKTNRNMMTAMANSAARIRRHIDKVGAEAVEKFVDDCVAIQDLIDPHSVFIEREPSKPGRPDDDEDPGCNRAVTRFDAKQYMNGWINPKRVAEREREEAKKKKQDKYSKDPSHPLRDVMLFLLNRAPLEDWQADILSIIRDEAYYYAPQGQTKIMNEGWAVYWHSVIMANYVATDADIVDFCEHNAGVLASGPGQFNPYKVGLQLFRDIEDRWNRGAHGKAYEEAEGLHAKERWGRNAETPRALGMNTAGRRKIFEVRQTHNDLMFIDEFLTPEFIDEHRLYQYRQDPETGILAVVNRDPEAIKRQLMFHLANHGLPYVYITDANYGNRGELCLGHRREFDADLDAALARDTLKALRRIWGRPVNLFAIIDGEPCRFSVDNDGEAKIEKAELPEPAHSL